MFTQINLKNFKCFQELSLPLAPLTLLSGLNSGGKSSIMQALAMLSHTLTRHEWSRRLILEGLGFNIGRVGELINQVSGGREISIGLETDTEQIDWIFDAQDREKLSLPLAKVWLGQQELKITPEEPLHWLLPTERVQAPSIVRALGGLSWLSAERQGPREILPLHDAPEHRRVGVRGERAAGLLYWHPDQTVLPGLRIEDEADLLFHQTRAYMRHFFSGSDFRFSAVEGANAITLSFRSHPHMDFQRPQNVGFGLTQLFPVIVALLAAQAGDLLLIENPEAHLHPRAQQEMGLLLAKAAAAGVQVILESHSDHVLNGIRLAVKRQILSAEKTALHFFSPELPGYQPITPRLDAEGRLDIWPEGFFDQFDSALMELF